LEVWDSVVDPHGRVSALHPLALVELRRHHWDEAKTLIEEELAINRALGESRPVGLALLMLSIAAFGQGDLTHGWTTIGEAAAIFQDIDDTSLLALADLYLGLFAATAGRFPEAADRYRASLHGFVDAGDIARLFRPLAGLAALAAGAGRPESAARLLGAVDALRARTGADLMFFDGAAIERAEAGALAVLGAEEFSAARESGRADGQREWLAEADIVVLVVGTASQFAGRRDVGAATGLTSRERQVLQLLVEGRSDREIADALGVRYRTVTSHVRNILTKLNAVSRTAAATHAVRSGLV